MLSLDITNLEEGKEQQATTTMGNLTERWDFICLSLVMN
jgi:hypothetical protein